jgi:hypothetical protein
MRTPRRATTVSARAHRGILRDFFSIMLAPSAAKFMPRTRAASVSAVQSNS